MIKNSSLNQIDLPYLKAYAYTQKFMKRVFTKDFRDSQFRDSLTKFFSSQFTSLGGNYDQFLVDTKKGSFSFVIEMIQFFDQSFGGNLAEEYD